MPRLHRLIAAVILVLVASLGLAGCGGDGSSSAGSLPTKVIDVTLTGGVPSPNGTKIDVAVGQKIQLSVTADAPGEIHVHSSPEEQEFEYQAGADQPFDIKPIPAPGQVTVESHTLDKVLFVLVAR
jgi:ABC-type glycerol-3-phosphate transport system substrate-binding protein